MEKRKIMNHLKLTIKIFIYCVLITFTATNIAASIPKVDSFIIELKAYQADTSSIEYANLLTQTGEFYAKDEFFELAKKYNFRSYTIAKSLKIDTLILKNLINLGEAHFWTSDYQKALVFLNEAINDYPMATSKDSSKIYMTFGNVYYYMDKKYLSYQNTLKAIKINKDLNNPQVMGDSYFVLAQMEVEQKRYNAGLEKINKAIAFYQSINNLRDLAYCYDILADIYNQLGQYDLALEYVKLSCESDDDDEYEQYYAAYCSHFYAEIYESMGEYNQALAHYKIALDQMNNSDQYGEIIETKADMGKLLAIKGDCLQGIKILESCIKLAKEKNSRPIIRDVYNNLFEAHNVCGNYKSGILFLQKYNALKDSLLQESNLEEVALLSSTNEIQQQKQELVVLQKDKKLRKIYSYLMGGAIFVLFLLIFAGNWTLKKQKQQNSLLATKKQTIEKKNGQLVQTNDELKRANLELNQFAYVVSHDLKAPLRGISTLASFIEEDLEEDWTSESKKDITQNIGMLKGRITRMGNLINGILEYSRIGRIEGKKELLDLKKILPETIQLIAPPSNFSIKLPSYLPSLNASKIALQQVFQNLLSNAIKYNDKSKGQIEIESNDLVGFFQFKIKDNGPGIPVQYHQKIFQIFQTLQPRDQVESTGIGLSIVEKIIKEQGNGKIWVEPTRGEGTTFVFTWEK